MASRAYQVGIVGSGFMAAAVAEAVRQQPMLTVASVLTRRNVASLTRFPVATRLITHKVNRLARNCDVVVDCTGDVLWATEVAVEMLRVGVPVITTNPGLQLVSGSSLAQMGTIVQAETGAAGTEAALAMELTEMGLVPLVYGQMCGKIDTGSGTEKGNRVGGRWSAEVAEKDGTQVALSQALVANGQAAGLAKSGMTGIAKKGYQQKLLKLVSQAREIGRPVVDYLVDPSLVGAVFVVAEARGRQIEDLKHLRIGIGPELMFIRPYQMGHLGVLRTIKWVLKGEGSLFNNSTKPSVQVVAVAKKDLKPGDMIGVGVGGGQVRGKVVRIYEMGEGVPVGLLGKTKVVKAVRAGEVVGDGQVELETSVARSLWEETKAQVIGDRLKVKGDRPVTTAKIRLMKSSKVGMRLVTKLVGKKKGGVYAGKN